MKIGLLGAFLALLFSIFSSGMDLSGSADSVLPLLLPICILLAGWYLAITMLPSPGKKLVLMLYKPLKKACPKVLGWLWEKTKNFFQ